MLAGVDASNCAGSQVRRCGSQVREQLCWQPASEAHARAAYEVIYERAREGEVVVVDGDTCLPPLKHTGRPHQAHQLGEPRAPDDTNGLHVLEDIAPGTERVTEKKQARKLRVIEGVVQ